MSTDFEQPETVGHFQQLLEKARLDGRQFVVAGAGSKQRIHGPKNNLVVSTTGYSGIVDHQASDFTITALAGTPVHDVIRVLGATGQFLPFDPVFAERGATLGGMIAAGLNGPCRLRFGGLRDFVIGCQFLDGTGKLIRAGGKVVKNAAGLDLPKFLVGSAGKFGLILEATFKVFPRPNCYHTMLSGVVEMAEAVTIIRKLLDTRIDFDAIEILEDRRVAVRWSGDDDERCGRIRDQLAGSISSPVDFLSGPAEAKFWNNLANFVFVGKNELVVKVPITRRDIVGLDRRLEYVDMRRRYGVAGNVAMIFVPNESRIGKVDEILRGLNLPGQVVGDAEHNLIGSVGSMHFLKRIKAALDPANVFGSIETSAGHEVSP